MDESFSAQSGVNRSTDSKSGSSGDKEKHKFPSSVSPSVDVSGIHSVSCSSTVLPSFIRSHPPLSLFMIDMYEIGASPKGSGSQFWESTPLANSPYLALDKYHSSNFNLLRQFLSLLFSFFFALFFPSFFSPFFCWPCSFI